MTSTMQPMIKAAEQEIQKYSEHFRPDQENAEEGYQGGYRDVRYPAHDAGAFVGFVFSGKVLHRSLHEPAMAHDQGLTGERDVNQRLAALQASMPPASGRTWRMPLRLRSNATLTAVASFGQAQ